MWPKHYETVDLVTFTEEILNGKLHCLCSVSSTSLDQQLAANQVHEVFSKN